MSAQPARAKVTIKGQVTLRRGLLDHIGVRPGGQIDIVPLPDGRLEVRSAADLSLQSLFGILKRPGQKPVSLEEINDTIEKGWAGQLTFKD